MCDIQIVIETFKNDNSARQKNLEIFLLFRRLQSIGCPGTRLIFMVRLTKTIFYKLGMEHLLFKPLAF